MPVPYPNFASATTSIPLSQLDNNFATTITLGNVAIQLGNVVTSLGNVTLTNTTISGLSGGSANGVVYINSSNVAVASPAVLAFDGTNLGLGVTPSAWYAVTTKAFQLGNSSAVYDYSASGNRQTGFLNNCYLNASGNYAYLNTDAATRYMQQNGVHSWYNAPSGNASSAITFTQAMTLDASSRLLVGLTSSLNANGAVQAGGFADTRVVIDATSTQGIYFTKSGADNGTWRVTSGGNYEWYVKGAGSANMTLDSSGNFIAGGTLANNNNSSSFGFNVVNGNQYNNHISGTAGGTGYIQFSLAGTVIGTITQNGTTGVLYNLTSDYRLKNDQQALTGAKNFIMALKPKKWQWWDGSGEGVGFIAHEFMEVAKYSGHGEKDAVDADGKPVYQSIQPSSSEVMANLVSFIQELSTQVTTLQAKVGV